MFDMRESGWRGPLPPNFKFRSRMMLPYYDPDRYGEMLEGHWSDRIAATVPISICGGVSDSCATITETTEPEKEKVPQIATVEIEEIEGDLHVGVKTKALKEVDFTPPVYRIAPKSEAYFNKHLDCAEQDSDGNHTLTVDTYCKSEDVGPQEGAWTIFHMNGLLLLKDDVCKIINGSNKYVKFTERFKVAVAEKATAPYIQLVCRARKAKYLNCWFREGEVITLFVRHKNTPNLPSPPILSVQPKVEQTYVPMLPKQRLQIITDASQATLEWRLGADSALLYCGNEIIPDERARLVGTKVSCDFFECTRPPDSQELVFVNSKTDNQFKTICVPVLSSGKGNRRYPVIIDPVRTCVIYAHNIEGFIIRSFKNIPLRIEKDCPLQAMYTMEGRDYSETKVKITKFQQYFMLERVSNQWVAKSG